MRNISRRRPYPSVAAPRNLTPFDGVLPVDKPAGPTSHDVVDVIRKTFHFRKVGHGGTLDPAATGLLLILVERGTRLSSLFMSGDKTYEGVMRLGISTNTQDADGEITGRGEWKGITREQLETKMRQFMGDIYQKPPMVSAVKVDGVPLYKHARKGKTVERKPRLIHVYQFSIRDFDPPNVSFVLRCTKGTYVRTICSDLGDALGCGAHLASLRRTRSGEIDVEQAAPLQELLALDRNALAGRIIPMSRFG